ncbi:MAG: chorismate mutase [Clostridia bacterium]|nr:chorismate mutase [Clostridia bacterium]
MDKLQSLRNEIDVIDDQIVQLFIKRLNVVKRIDLVKKQNGASAYDENRQNDVLKRLTFGLDEPTKSAVISLYERIFEVALKMQS